MINVNQKSSYIYAILNRIIVINCEDKSKFKFLKESGGKRHWFKRNVWDIPIQVNDEKMLASILSSLRDNGFYFAGAPAGWPPAAIFKKLRTEGLVEGDFTEITWRGVNDPIIWDKQ